MDATTLLSPFARRRTALLTTFRRDGTGVDTPVTIAIEGDHAYMRTYDRAWKAKRLRNDPSVRIAPATMLGRPRGEAVAARAVLLDGAEAVHAARAIARRQRILQGVLVPLFHRLKHYRTLHYRVIPVEVADYSSCSTDSTLPAGSRNHAIGGPSPRITPFSSCGKPS
jgi:uncharacterized protein